MCAHSSTPPPHAAVCVAPKSEELTDGTCAVPCPSDLVRNQTSGECVPPPIVCSAPAVPSGGSCSCVIDGVGYDKCTSNDVGERLPTNALPAG